MAIDFIGTSGLFTRLGRLAGLLKWSADEQYNLNLRRHDTLASCYAGQMNLLGTLPDQLLTTISTPPSFVALVEQAAVNTLIEMVKADAPERASSVAVAVAEVIRQMRAHATSTLRHVPVCAVTTANAASYQNPTTGLSNVGNPRIYDTPKQPLGQNGENLFAEHARLSMIDQTTPGQETWRFTGAASASTLWGYDWPAGSSVEADFSGCDPVADGGESGVGSNSVYNGSFELWDDTTTLPTGWTSTPTANSGATQSSTHRRGSYSLRMDTTTQAFLQATTAIKPLTAYAISMAARLPPTATGVPTTLDLRLEALDAAGNVLTGTDSSVLEIKIAAVNSSSAWVQNSAKQFWFTPQTPVASLRLRIESHDSGTASSTGYCLVDDIAITEVFYPYPGGPGLAVIAGSIDPQQGDGYELTMTNDRNSASYGYTWQAVFDRFFSMRSAQLQLPSGSAGSTDIADSLIDTDPAIADGGGLIIV